jgi:hypothetical protein
MTPKGKGCLLSAFVAIVFISIIIFITYENNKYNDFHKKQLDIIGNIELTGKVVKLTVLNRNNKNYYTMCVKVNYANNNDFYIFNELCALKIKNGIATIPGGVFDTNFITDSVEINWNKSGKEKFYYKNGKSDEFPLSLASSGISKNDLNICN